MGVVTTPTSIDNGLVKEGVASSLDKGRHEPQFDSMSLLEVFLPSPPHLNDITDREGERGERINLTAKSMILPHVHLIECGEHCISVLSILQSLSNSLSHSVHLHLNTTPTHNTDRSLVTTGTHSLLYP